MAPGVEPMATATVTTGDDGKPVANPMDRPLLPESDGKPAPDVKPTAEAGFLPPVDNPADVKVDPALIIKFAEYLVQLRDGIYMPTHEKIQALTVVPGRAPFPQSEHLQKQLGHLDTEGLKATLSKALEAIHQSLTTADTGLRAMAKEYTTTDELNKMTGKDLYEQIPELPTQINGLSPTGVT